MWVEISCSVFLEQLLHILFQPCVVIKRISLYRDPNYSFGFEAPLQEKVRPRPPLASWQDRNVTGRLGPLKFLDFKLNFEVYLNCNKCPNNTFQITTLINNLNAYSYLNRFYRFFRYLMIYLHEFLHVLRWPRPYKQLNYKRIK